MVAAGFDAHQEAIKIGLEICLVVRRHHAVDARRAILARQAIGFHHPFAVDQVMQPRSAPARDVPSPDRLSIVVSWTGLWDSEFPPVFLVNGSMRAAAPFPPAGPGEPSSPPSPVL